MPRLSRRRAALGGVFALVAVAGLAYLLWPAPPPVTWATMTRTPAGRTRAEMYAAVGGPPGDYRRHGFVGSPPNTWIDPDRPPSAAETWTCDEGVLHVWFDKDGLMTSMVGLPSHDFRPTLVQRVQRMLGL